MNPQFRGKRILVTGAGQGIGRGLTKKLVEAGAVVTGICLVESALASLKKEIGESFIPVKADLTSPTIRQTLRKFGPFDMLVNNAGVAILEPFLEATEEKFDKLFNINVRAMFIVAQEVARMMTENNIKGSIVHTSSTSSTASFKDHTAYCMSKAAVDMLTKMMAFELGPFGIRVNCVNPTVVLTDLGKACWSDPVKAGGILCRIPLGRFAEVEEIGNVIMFLLSDDASMVNGVQLPIDGGYFSN